MDVWHGTIFKGPSLHVALQHLEVIILFVFRKRSSSVLTEYVSGEVSVSLLSQQTGGQAIPLLGKGIDFIEELPSRVHR